ncbi:MAG: TetR/AcrR family transcriptional regulator [Bacteroidia bacterium]
MVHIVNKTKSYFTICETASNLFHKFGIKKVSVEELCEEAGVSKMTFYRIFKNKDELVHHIVLEDFTQGLNKNKELLDSDLAFPDKIKAAIHLKKELSSQYSKEFMFDLLNSKDQELINMMQEFGIKGRVIFREFLEENQTNGNIRKSLNIDFLIYFLGQIQEMVPSEDVINLFDSVEAYSEHMINLLFYGIFSDQ